MSFEIWDYDKLEQNVLEAEKPSEIAAKITIAICTLLTPAETAVLLSLYDGKDVEQIAKDSKQHVNSVYRIRARIAKKLEPLFEGHLGD